MCDEILRIAEPFNGDVIINDRADLARLSGAAGVHVGQEDLPPRSVRAVVGADAIVGLSTHTIEQVEAALREPITYLAVGPVFGTATKDTGYAAVGLDLVRAARARVPATIPIVAIGGVTVERARSVLDAGATMVAAIGDLLAGDPRERVAAYCRALM